MEATELRIKTDELEKQVKALINNFIGEVGACDIKIKTNFDFIESVSGRNILVNTGVKVFVTV